jgi:hypothetical protein
MRSLLLLGGLGLVGYGAYTYYKTEVAILEESDISLSGIKVIDKSPSNVTLRISVNITNNSEIDFTIRKYDLAFIINNSFIGKIINSNVDTLVKGFGGTSQITFDFSFNPKEVGIANVIYSLLTRRGTSKFTTRGFVSVKKGLISVDAPIDVTYSLRELLED